MTKGFLERVETRPSISLSSSRTTCTQAYADAALRNRARDVATAVENTRNDTLNRAAYQLRPYITGGALDEWFVIDELTTAARVAGLDDFEIPATIQSGFNGSDADNRSPIRLEEPQQIPSPLSPIHPGGDDGSPSNLDGSTAVWGEFPPVDGASWMWDADDVEQTILWGIDNDILWADGEALMIAGGMGLGKSTLAGMLVRAQLGLRSEVLGLPVAPMSKPILYLAMDRPRQIRRSMRRQFSEEERDLIKGRLFVRQGPPVADLAVYPPLLARMAMEIGAGVVYIDSLKDAVIGLSQDEVAAAYNRARQYLLAQGINILELHHNRKPGADSGSTISEIFGSTWLTSGAGSVIMLIGEPGDLVIRFHHRKMPADEVGPWHLHYDPDGGEMKVATGVDLWKAVNNAGPEGLTAEGAAKIMYEKRHINPSDCRKAARQLDKLVKQGSLTRIDGERGSAWFVANVTDDSDTAQVLPL